MIIEGCHSDFVHKSMTCRWFGDLRLFVFVMSMPFTAWLYDIQFSHCIIKCRRCDVDFLASTSFMSPVDIYSTIHTNR